MQDTTAHIPVLLDAVTEAINAQDGETVIDATFGAGGYSRALLNQSACQVIAIDRDPHVLPYAQTCSRDFGSRFAFRQGRFSEMAALVADYTPVDAIMFDIGVSSMQIDQPERGFSFRYDGALDMRMSGEGRSAADIIAQEEETELARILWEYGEERASRRIARAIVAAREEMPITTTGQLKAIIHSVLYPKHNQIDPATRSFQALRIAVNGELEELRSALETASSLLLSGGRLVVVTFHSLEDRIVKQYFKACCEQPAATSRHLPDTQKSASCEFSYIYRKPRIADDMEITANPRARSAKCRAIIKHGGKDA